MFCSMFRDVLSVNWIPLGASLMKKCEKQNKTKQNKKTKKKNKKKQKKKKRDYLQISYVHFDFRKNCLLIMWSVYLNRGLTI